MGPYCKYCGRRCFVARVLRDGREVSLATCSGGMQLDRDVLDEDHRTAINPASGRPGYDTAEFRATARQLGTRARYLAYGSSDVPAEALLEEMENLVAHLRRSVPRPAGVTADGDSAEAG